MCNALGYKCVIFMPNTQSQVREGGEGGRGREGGEGRGREGEGWEREGGRGREEEREGGNTGIGLAHMCNALGYKCVIFMSNTQSQVRVGGEGGRGEGGKREVDIL